MAQWMVVKNLRPTYVVISDEHVAIQLAPEGWPGSIAAVLMGKAARSELLQRLNTEGWVDIYESDYVPAYGDWPNYLPSDRWQRAAVVDIVLGPDERASELINLAPTVEAGVSDNDVQRFLKKDLVTILMTAERWLEEQKAAGKPKAEERLQAVSARIRNIRDSV